MKKIMTVAALAISALAVFTAQAFAQAVPTNNSAALFSFDINSYFRTKYVSPFDKLLYNKPVIQSEITMWMEPEPVPGKFYLGVWDSESFHGLNSNPGDEVDYKLGWKGEVYKGINLNFRATYLDFVPIGTMPENRDQVWFVTELDRKFAIDSKSVFGDSKTSSSITPFVRFEVPWGLKGYRDRSGLRTYFGAKGDWEFMPCWSVSQKANLLIDDGAVGLQPGKFFDYQVGLSWKVNKWLEIDPCNFRVMTPITSVSDCRKTEKIFGAGFQASF